MKNILLLFFSILLFYFFAGNTCTEAHPHMFIDCSATFKFDSTGLAGIYIYWKFDEMNSAVILLDFDKDKNNELSKIEQIGIYNRIFKNSAKYNFFTHIGYGIELPKIKEVQQFKASIKDKKHLLYSFYIPLNLSIEKIVNGLMWVYFEDATMFAAFDLKKNLVQVYNKNSDIETSLSFGKMDYIDKIILTIKKGNPLTH